ncbi:hypothetical protein SCFA_500019 [anaerobic digester metagenome]|uniref:Uncharacterized protein n=1 Tax=anaerobic digester metagenome TaxID=1263854 RepID=A0A485M1T0_9ZZZZ
MSSDIFRSRSWYVGFLAMKTILRQDRRRHAWRKTASRPLFLARPGASSKSSPLNNYIILQSTYRKSLRKNLF